MKTKSQTAKDYFKTLTLIYYSIIAVQFAFGLFAYLYTAGGGSLVPGENFRGTLIYLVPVFVIGGFVGGNMFFKKRLDATKTKNGLTEKMAEYRSASIVRYALLEAPYFFSIVAYLLTKDLLFIGFGGMIILFFLTIKPTKEKAANELELNATEKNKINNPDAVIAEVKLKN
jgi:hypothetical protein